MYNVMTVVGTRPEIIRLSRIISLFDQFFSHTLVHTGQNFDYELNEIFFDQLGLRKPDVFLEAAGVNGAETIGKVIIAADKVMEEVRPDALLILGDTNSCLAAIAAKRRKIPIFHMEAGNRCFDFRVPEEINRRIVDHTADINLTYSQIARDYLLREGFPPDQVIVTGSPMREVIDHYREGIDRSDIIGRLHLTPREFYLVSAHREENVDAPGRLRKLVDVLNALAELYRRPVVVSTHPRTRKRIEALEADCAPEIRFEKPFGFLDYVKLQIEARAVLSDSGTITEESSILNFPAVTLRDVHERPEGTEEASVMMTGLNVRRVLDALAILADQPRGGARLLKLPADYAADNVSAKVLRIVQGYTDFVKERVWRADQA